MDPTTLKVPTLGTIHVDACMVNSVTEQCARGKKVVGDRTKPKIDNNKSKFETTTLTEQYARDNISTARVTTSTEPYNGANGRPEHSIEKICVAPHITHHCPDTREHQKARQIQRTFLYWTRPRLRAKRYRPENLARVTSAATGKVRLPGFELATREAVALLFLLEGGRLTELIRSLAQLLERGATLTEVSYLPLVTLARRLGEPAIAAAVLSFAEVQHAHLSSRTYAQVIQAYTDDKHLEFAEAITQRAIRRGFLPPDSTLGNLQCLGSYSPPQWRARWRLQARRDAEEGIRPIPKEMVSIVVTQGFAPNRKVLSAPTGLLGLKLPLTSTLPSPSSTQPEQLIKIIEAIGVLTNSAKNTIAKLMLSHPEGHVHTQMFCPKSISANDRKWLDPTTLMSPRVTWLRPQPQKNPKETTLTHLKVWHINLDPGDDCFFKNENTPCWRWEPVDEAVWSLSRSDTLGILGDLLVRAAGPTPVRAEKSHDDNDQGHNQMTQKPRVLIACEESLVVNSRMSATNLITATSVDLTPPEYLGCRHIVSDASTLLQLGSWHGLIAFPPCTYLTLSSGLYASRPGRKDRMLKSIEFFKELFNAPIPQVAIENPKHHSAARDTLQIYPTQTIHPHQYGSPVTKSTQLFLKNLPPLQPTRHVSGRLHTFMTLAPTAFRGMIRARTFDGIARPSNGRTVGPGVHASSWPLLREDCSRGHPQTNRSH